MKTFKSIKELSSVFKDLYIKHGDPTDLYNTVVFDFYNKESYTTESICLDKSVDVKTNCLKSKSKVVKESILNQAFKKDLNCYLPAVDYLHYLDNKYLINEDNFIYNKLEPNSYGQFLLKENELESFRNQIFDQDEAKKCLESNDFYLIKFSKQKRKEIVQNSINKVLVYLNLNNDYTTLASYLIERYRYVYKLTAKLSSDIISSSYVVFDFEDDMKFFKDKNQLLKNIHEARVKLVGVFSLPYLIEQEIQIHVVDKGTVLEDILNYYE